MPTMNRGHTHAPTVLIGERAADLIRHRAPTDISGQEGLVLS
jgi:choline dehydrogenase-like flavoprotein